MEENTTATVEALEASASGEDLTSSEASEVSSDVIVLTSDYSSELNTIIDIQNNQLELLTEEKSILLEQINGLTLIAQYQHSFFGIAIGVIVVTLLWNVLNKWFFRGV